MQQAKEKKKVRPRQKQQQQPGLEYLMDPLPVFFDGNRTAGDKLKDKVCIITGGDSGIGKAVAVDFARQSAKIVIVYLNEERDAKDTKDFIQENFPTDCMLIRSDIRKESNCKKIILQTVKKFERVDVLVNNAGVHYPIKNFEETSAENLLSTFQTNIFSMFWLVKHALPYMQAGSSIINTSSVTAYRGSGHLVDYSATKGAIVSFTRSLSANLAERKIRVNGVAPGPVWTPLIAASFDPKHISEFGTDVPLGRTAQPFEIAPAFLFLACNDSEYITGQIIHVNGGEIVNG
jgi:NAD(P)-dependent dehydrogenase (short-subunit alcohol dehydrogenase family)